MGHIKKKKKTGIIMSMGYEKRSLMREVWGSGFWVLWSMLPER